MAYLVLSAVSTAIYTALNVAGLTALVSTRIYDDVPQDPTFPFVWYEVKERDVRGLGTRGLPEVELRVHVFSSVEDYEGPKQAQTIGAKVIELLRDQPLTISGYAHCGLVFYDETQLFNDQIIAGVRVRELVSMFRIYAEES
jgi:hypothetical protein